MYLGFPQIFHITLNCDFFVMFLIAYSSMHVTIHASGIRYFHIHMFIGSLYKEQTIDGSNTGVKWSCPNIHDLMTILDKIQLELILDNVFDKRISKLEQLSVVQLREECQCNNPNKHGNKV